MKAENEILYSKIYEYIAIGDFKKAEMTVRQILKSEPNNLKFLNKLGDILNIKKDSSAENIFNKVVEKDSKNIDAIIGLAKFNFINNNYNKSIILLEKAKNIDSQNEIVYSRLASTYRMIRDNEKAIKNFIKAIILTETKPQKDALRRKNLISLYYNLANLYLESQEWNDAIKYFKLLIEKEPADFEVLFLIALSYKQKGDLEEAKIFLNRSINIRENNEAYQLLADIYLEQNNFDKSKKYYELLIKRGERNEYNYFNLGTTYFNLNNLNKSIEFYKKTIDINENKIEAYDMIWQIYKKMGNKEKAKEYKNKADQIDLKKYMTKEKIRSLWHESKANSLEKEGKFSKSIEHFLKAIEYTPNDTRIYSNVANIYIKIGDKIKAEEYYKKSIEKDRNNYDSYFNLGSLYLDERRFEDALVAFKKVIELNPDDWEAINSLYNIYQFKLINKDEAKKYKERLELLKSTNSDVKVQFDNMIKNYVENEQTKEEILEFVKNMKEFEKSNLFKVMEFIKDEKYNEMDVFINDLDKKEQIDVYLNLAKYYVENNELENAKFYYNTLLTMEEDKTYYYNLGWIYVQLGDLKKAEEYHKKAIKMDKNYSENYRQLGYISEQKGDLELAKEYYLKTISISPKDAIAYFNLGVVNENEKKLNLAEKYYLKAEELNFVDASINLASLYLDLKNFKKAEFYFQKSIEQNPLGFPYFEVGSSYHQIKNFKEAEKYLIKAVELKPNNIDTLRELAFVYLKQNKITHAKVLLKKAMKLMIPEDELKKMLSKDDDLDRLLNKTVDKELEIMGYRENTTKQFVKKKKGNKKKKLKIKRKKNLNKELKKALKDGKESEFINNEFKKKKNIESLLNSFKKDKSYNPQANDTIRKYMEKGKGTKLIQVMYLTQEATLLSENGKFEEAIKILESAKILLPDYAETYNSLGIIYEKLGVGEYIKSIVYFEKAIELNPEAKEFYNNLGNIYKDLGKITTLERIMRKEIIDDEISIDNNYDKAIELFKTAIELDENYDSPYNGMGSIYRILGEKEESLYYYEKLLKINPSYRGLYNNLGNLYRDLEDYEKAIEFFKKSIKKYPNKCQVYKNLASIYLIDEYLDYDRAIKYLKMSIKKMEDANLFYQEHIPSYFTISKLYFYKKDYDNSVRYLDKLLKRFPEYSSSILSNYVYLLDNLLQIDKENKMIYKLKIKIKNIFKPDTFKVEPRMIELDKDFTLGNFYKDNIWKDIHFLTLLNILEILTDKSIPNITIYKELAFLLDDKNLDKVISSEKFKNMNIFTRKIKNLKSKIKDEDLLFLNIRTLFIELVKKAITEKLYSKTEKKIEDYQKITNLSEIHITITNSLQESIIKLIKEKNEQEKNVMQAVSHTIGNLLVDQKMITKYLSNDDKLENRKKRLMFFQEITSSLLESIKIAFGGEQIGNIKLFKNSDNERISLKSILYFTLNINLDKLLKRTPFWEPIYNSFFNINDENKKNIKENKKKIQKNSFFNILELSDIELEKFIDFFDSDDVSIINSRFNIDLEMLNNIYVEKNGYTFAIFFTIFHELIFNIFKYADISKEKKVELNLNIDKDFYIFSLSNYIFEETEKQSGTLRGLKMIEMFADILGGFEKKTDKDRFVIKIKINKRYLE